MDGGAASRRGWSTEAPPPHVFSLMLIYIALNIAVILPEERAAKAKQGGNDRRARRIFSGIREKVGTQELCPRSSSSRGGSEVM